MTQITVSDELARAITQAGSFAILIDSKGRAIGEVKPVDLDPAGPVGMTDEHFAELKRRMTEDDGTRYSWAEVKEHLRALTKE